jgi:hypothetical protein
MMIVDIILLGVFYFIQLFWVYTEISTGYNCTPEERRERCIIISKKQMILFMIPLTPLIYFLIVGARRCIGTVVRCYKQLS